MALTIGRTLESFRGDYLNARDFGCSVDGVTDDTVQFQAAVNACAYLRAPLMVPGDNMLVTNGLVIPKRGLTLVTRGYGYIQQKAAAAVTDTAWITCAAASLIPWAAATIFALNDSIIDPAGHEQLCVLPGTSGSSIPTFDDDGGTVAEGTGKPSWQDQGLLGNHIIEGLTFDGNSANQTATGAHLIDLINVANVTIRNCNFQNSTGRCVSGQKLSGLTIEGGHYVNWQPGNYGAIQLWASNDGLTGGPVTGVRISGVTIDGTVSGSTCIKLAGSIPDSRYPGLATVNAPLSQVYVGGGTRLYLGTTSNLGLEFFALTNLTGTYYDVVVDGVQVYGAGTNIGLSFSDGGVTVTCTDFTVESCLVGLEAYASESVFCNGTINNPQVGIAINGSYENRANTTVSHIEIINPTQYGVEVYAANDSGLGPFSNSNLLLDNIDVIGIQTNGIGIYFLCNAVGASIINSKVHNCRLLGAGGATNTAGVAFNANSETIDDCAVELSWFDGLTYGIGVDDTNGRFLLNRFSGTVGTQYSGIGGTDYVVSADPGGAGGPLTASGAPGTAVLELTSSATGVVAIEGIIQGTSGPSSYPVLNFKDPSGVIQASIQLDGAPTFFTMPVAIGGTAVSSGYAASITGKAYITSDLLAQGKFACNGAAAQSPYASGGGVPGTSSTNTTPYGFTTSTQADAIVTLVNNIRAALLAYGIMS